MTCSLWENCVGSCSGPRNFRKTVLDFFMQRMHESGVNLYGEGDVQVPPSDSVRSPLGSPLRVAALGHSGSEHSPKPAFHSKFIATEDVRHRGLWNAANLGVALGASQTARNVVFALHKH